MELDDDPNLYEDVEVPVGCDLVWGFQLQPWDATASTAVFNVLDANDEAHPFSMTITITPGVDVISEFDVHLTPAQLATLGLNVSGTTLSYNVRYTATNGAVLGIGYGEILITS